VARILCIDDEPGIQRMVRNALERDGHVNGLFERLRECYVSGDADRVCVCVGDGNG
jgi:DNA-binding NtrC family response regulator